MKLCTCEAGLCCAMRDQAIRAREANDRREHTRRSCNTRRSAPRRQKRCPYLPMPTSQPNMPCHGYYTIRGGCVLCVPVRVFYFHIECAHFDIYPASVLTRTSSTADTPHPRAVSGLLLVSSETHQLSSC